MPVAGKRSRVARSVVRPDSDPLYAQVVRCMQQGQWDGAREGLAALKMSYQGSEELEKVDQDLALHLAVEESWLEEERRLAATPLRVAGRLAATSLRVPAVRFLSIANVVIYLMFGVLWLVARLGGPRH